MRYTNSCFYTPCFLRSSSFPSLHQFVLPSPLPTLRFSSYNHQQIVQSSKIIISKYVTLFSFIYNKSVSAIRAKHITLHAKVRHYASSLESGANTFYFLWVYDSSVQKKNHLTLKKTENRTRCIFFFLNFELTNGSHTFVALYSLQHN